MLVTDITRDQFPATRMQALVPDGRIIGGGAGGVRSAGLHISQIYRSIEDTIGSTYADNGISPEELAWYAAGGFMWERVFSLAMAESFRIGEIVRPGEFMVDGIIGSPDNWNMKTGHVIETKCTWRSSRKLDKLERHFWVWLVQMQGYCRLLGTRTAELYVYFVNGNYAPPIPVAKALQLEWGAVEIAENWEMLKRHAKSKGWI